MTAATAKSDSRPLAVDDLELTLRRSSRRRSMEITIERDGALTMVAPPGVDDEALESFVREKKFWIYTKLAEKAARQQPVVAKEFVTGEGFSYLGRSYRLLLVDEQEQPLKLEAGRFKLNRAEAASGRQHFIAWYTSHARVWLRRRVKQWASRMGVVPSGIEIRDLGYRWGSCGQAGGLNFHWATILLPASVVDYVIVHELAHLQEPNHTPEFWQLVARTLPDYEQRKDWLAANGGGAVLL